MQKSEGPALDLTLPVEKLVYGGAGLSRHEGRVVMTPEMLNELIRQKPANIGTALRDWVDAPQGKN